MVFLCCGLLFGAGMSLLLVLVEMVVAGIKYSSVLLAFICSCVWEPIVGAVFVLWIVVW